MDLHRGEIFFAELSPVQGSEQGGNRPVLVVQNDIGNHHSPTTIVSVSYTHLDVYKRQHPYRRRYLRYRSSPTLF